MKQEIKNTYIVKGRQEEAPGVVTLKLAVDNGSDRGFVPAYRPGQFITVYFPESGTPEGKAYSISSAPHEATLNITVKGIGEFSNKLCAMNVGGTITASVPYGYFYSEEDDKKLIMLAGGIGVAPFRSMILDSLRRTPNRRLTLFQSCRTRADKLFKKEFAEISKMSSNFQVIYFITREKVADAGLFSGRMKTKDIIGVHVIDEKHVNDREFLICGSISFVRDLWRGLKERGVPEDAMYTEAFFSN